MSSLTMVALVGEQPAPNLLPLSHYRPQRVVLVHSDLTEARARRLAELLKKRDIPVEQPMCKIDAYRIDHIMETLEVYFQEQELTGDQLIFNLTGGTKTMALATYEVARGSNAAAFYYQTEDNQSLIHPYRFSDGRTIAGAPIPIDATLTLDDYLRLYVGDYKQSRRPKDRFEEMVFQALSTRDEPDFEVMPATYLTGLGGDVEVDMLARRGNQVAAFEVKQTADKKGIDQLVGVTGQRTLGTYTRRILVSATPLNYNQQQLAAAHRVRVVVLPSGRSSTLSGEDAQTLFKAVWESLGPRRA